MPHSILRTPRISESDHDHLDLDMPEYRSRAVSFSATSKQEDGDFILFPDHVPYPREAEAAAKWRNFFINRKTYTFIYGAAGCIYSASFRYFNGTITTMEKRFKIPSRNTGIISSGNDISQVFASILLTYYASGKNKPKWMSFSLYAIALYCLMSAMPHFLYGPGKDALQLTEEHRFELGNNLTDFMTITEKRKSLCNVNGTIAAVCDPEGGELAPQVLLFSAQVIFGIAESVYYVFGLSYLDDNVSRAKTPLMISELMLGPAVGYSLASFCLKFYIDPTLHPMITSKDPRWLGCWWAGWIFIALILVILGYCMGQFPKELNKSENKQQLTQEHIKRRKIDSFLINKEAAPLNEYLSETSVVKNKSDDDKPSFKGLKESLSRLLNNKILMFNNFSTVLTLIGAIPYWMFAPKYFEIQYLQTPSEASFKVGTISFIFSGLGVLMSGFIITKLKPTARQLAAWNVFTTTISIFGLIANYYLGCDANDTALTSGFELQGVCNVTEMCHCDYVKYAPVCGSNNQTYISACHAGCVDEQIDPQLNIKVFTNCSCIENDNNKNALAVQGACPIDCYRPMMAFLAIIYLKKFLGASGLAGNFLVSLRCIEKRDKPLSVGLMLMMTSLLAFIPAPIYFGINMDRACLLWGKTCSTKGNCWLYDGPKMRFAMNIVGAFFVTLGTLLDVGVWYHAKNLKIFEDDDNDEEKKDNGTKKQQDD
uniref:Solute carrier organic anion transporter family member n=1 Tax=Culicoides sonorensis TaxID=179676 RepID=A0A336MHM0_CULSO